ncbi:MAG: hypothetical protein DI596_09880 [Azospira oryzae]|nr:MAG: hypothetical protein DI596_09880 [Azospira oryzae]PZP78696.1 MAG: hypothetical protein DI593_09880 [Azospira oryzae]
MTAWLTMEDMEAAEQRFLQREGRKETESFLLGVLGVLRGLRSPFSLCVPEGDLQRPTTTLTGDE